MEQLTSEQARELYDSGAWTQWSNQQIVELQLFQDYLCMPFSRFRKAIEDVLKRPVYTHEFAYSDLLRKEFLRERPEPTFQEILDLLPMDSKVVIAIIRGPK